MFLSFKDWFYSPILIELGPLVIVKYAFMIMLGIVGATIMGLKECEKLGIKKDDVLDGLLYIVPIAILGTRLWYCIFEWEHYKNNLISILYIWEGGLAIHGGIITAIICVYFYCKKRKIDLFCVFDMLAPGFLIGQIFGRWGNFFNTEAHGPIVGGGTLLPSEQKAFLKSRLIPEFVIDNMAKTTNGTGYLASLNGEILGYYHPTFFYESMWNVAGLIMMFILRRTKKTRTGELLSLYLVWYSIGRFMIESLRTDSLYFELFGFEIRTAQATSIALIILGVLLFVFIRFIRKNKYYYQVLEENKNVL